MKTGYLVCFRTLKVKFNHMACDFVPMKGVIVYWLRECALEPNCQVIGYVATGKLLSFSVCLNLLLGKLGITLVSTSKDGCKD